MSGETTLQTAERHVREGDERVRHQEARLAELVRDGHRGQAIELAEKVLANLRKSVDLARVDLERERASAGP